MNETAIGATVIITGACMILATGLSIYLDFQRNKLTKNINNALMEIIGEKVKKEENLPSLDMQKAEQALAKDNTGIVYEQYVPPVQPVVPPQETKPQPQPVQPEPVVAPNKDEALRAARRARMKKLNDARKVKRAAEAKAAKVAKLKEELAKEEGKGLDESIPTA